MVLLAALTGSKLHALLLTYRDLHLYVDKDKDTKGIICRLWRIGQVLGGRQRLLNGFERVLYTLVLSLYYLLMLLPLLPCSLIIRSNISIIFVDGFVLVTCGWVAGHPQGFREVKTGIQAENFSSSSERFAGIQAETREC